MTLENPNFASEQSLSRSVQIDSARFLDYINSPLERTTMFPRGDQNNLPPEFQLPSIRLHDYGPEAGPSFGQIPNRAWGIMEAQFGGGSEQVNRQITNHVLDRMSPENRQQCQREAQALQNYEAAFSAWTMQRAYGMPPPERPNTPMLEAVNEKVASIRRSIAKSVDSRMSPDDNRRIQQELGQVREGGWFSSARVPENGALREYYDRIRVAANDFIRKNR